MADHICFYVQGKPYNYPDEDFWKQDKSDREVYEAYRLAATVAGIQWSLIDMIADIQHQTFRLGSLGGLKGDAKQAFMDQVGESCRQAKVAMFQPLIRLGLFEDDLMNVAFSLSNHEPQRNKERASLGVMKPETFVDWDGAGDIAKAESRPLFQYDLNACVAEGQCGGDGIHDVSLRYFFFPLLASSVGSLMDKLVETGMFAFGSGVSKVPNEITAYDPHSMDKGEIFVGKAREMLMNCVMMLIRKWVHKRLLVACPECYPVEAPQEIILYPGELCVDTLDTCPKCHNSGLVFSKKVRTRLPFDFDGQNRIFGDPEAVIRFN